MKTLWPCLGMLLSLPALAALLEFSGTPAKRISASGMEVPVFEKAKVSLDQSEREVFLTGAGIRTKSILKVNVYVAISYVDLPQGLPARDAMEGVRKSKTRAIQLTFLRDVKAKQIRSSFADALEANGVEIETSPVKEVLEALTFDLREKSNLTVVSFEKSPEDEVLLLETAERKMRFTGKNLGFSFWKIWFGKPADRGLETLREALLSPGVPLSKKMN